MRRASQAASNSSCQAFSTATRWAGCDMGESWATALLPVAEPPAFLPLRVSLATSLQVTERVRRASPLASRMNGS